MHDTNDAFLAFDRNGNGQIDDGSELFGDATPLLSGGQAQHGFEALAEYDLPINGGNADGTISNGDAIFSQLLLWTDSDRDGRPGEAELKPAETSGLQSISLDYFESRRRDRHGNLFR